MRIQKMIRKVKPIRWLIEGEKLRSIGYMDYYYLFLLFICTFNSLTFPSTNSSVLIFVFVSICVSNNPTKKSYYSKYCCKSFKLTVICSIYIIQQCWFMTDVVYHVTHQVNCHYKKITYQLNHT